MRLVNAERCVSQMVNVALWQYSNSPMDVCWKEKVFSVDDDLAGTLWGISWTKSKAR